MARMAGSTNSVRPIICRIGMSLASAMFKFHSQVLITVILIILAFNFACTRDKNEQKIAINNPSDSLMVVKVLDGDTFVLADGKSVRIAMIDAPEKGQPLYREATQYVMALLLNQRVKLIPAGAGHDIYGRLLAEVYLDTLNVGCSILKAGLAVIYIYSDNIYLKDKYLPAQITALKEKTGIWSLPDPAPEDFYINIKGSLRFHRPLCPHLKNSRPAKVIRYESREKALKQGLSPCRTCRP